MVTREELARVLDSTGLRRYATGSIRTEAAAPLPSMSMGGGGGGGGVGGTMDGGFGFAAGVRKVRASELLAKMDRDKSGTVDFDEFSAFLKAGRKSKKTKKSAAARNKELLSLQFRK